MMNELAVWLRQRAQKLDAAATRLDAWLDRPLFWALATLLFAAAYWPIATMWLDAPGWYDELVTLYRVNLPWAQMFADASEYAGVQLWELALLVLGLHTLTTARLAAAAATGLALWAVWILDERAEGAAAFALYPVFPATIWHAQDARMYAAFTALYFWALVAVEAGHWLRLAALLGLLVYIHPVGVVYAGAAWLIALRRRPRDEMARVTVTLGLAALPRLAGLLLTTSGGSGFWLERLTPAQMITSLGQAAFVETVPGLLAGLGLLALAVWHALDYGVDDIGAAALLPLAGLALVSLWRPVWFYRPLVPAAGALILWLARYRRYAGGAFVRYVLLLALMGAGLITLTTGVDIRGGNMAEAAALIHEGDRVAYATMTVALPLDAILPDVDACLVDIPDVSQHLTPPTMTGLYPPCPDDLHGYWVAWPDDPLLPDAVRDDFRSLGVPALTVGPWQVAPIHLVRVGY